jgi:pyridoxine kinase
MPTILSLSSQVAYGHVGHSAGVFAWQRLGIDVIALPTVLLSNRPDLPHKSGERVRPELLADMFAALEANGRLGEIDAVFTGYLPSAAHAELAARIVTSLKAESANLLYCCDPILGDEPGGLYVAEDAAWAVRDAVMPLADVVTPNSFELGWLTGRAVTSADETIAAARALAPMVLATSAPAADAAQLANLLVTPGEAWETLVARRDAAPHGTGDLMASLFLAHMLRLRRPLEALALTTAGIEAVIEASIGAEELRLIESQEAWAAAAPWPVNPAEGQGA